MLIALRPDAPASQRSSDAVHCVLGLLEDAQASLHTDRESACRFLVRALAILRQEHSPRPVPRRTQGCLAEWQCKRVVAFIDEHLSEPIRTTRLALALGLSVSHFSHAFKQSFGVTPLVYIAQRRIASARQAMLDSEASLTEIAHSHGFCDQSHFSRTFRQQTGLTPHAWRRLRDLERQALAPLAEHARPPRKQAGQRSL